MKIGIIGAGATGMAAAWDLLRAGHEVTLYEAEIARRRAGGRLQGRRAGTGGWRSSTITGSRSDKDILQLAEEMGVRDKIMFPRPKTSYWMNGKIIRSEITPLSALTLPLPLLAKPRFLLAARSSS